MAGKISEYTPVTSANDDDLIDISVHLGGGIYETRSIAKINLVPAGSVVTPEGSSGDVQYNLNGAFAGDSTLGIDDDGLVKITSSTTVASTALGVMKLRYDDVNDEYIMSTSVNDYVLNIDHFLNLKDVDYGLPLNESVPIYDSVSETFDQALTVQDVSVLSFGEQAIIAQQALSDVLKDGYQLTSMTIISTDTGSATVDIGTSLGGSEVYPGLSIAGIGEHLLDITELTKTVAKDGSDITLYITASSFTDISLNVLHKHTQIR